MQVTDKGQVTIPKHIRTAAGVLPGSEVAFSLEAGRIVISKVGSGIKTDRREQLRAAAARVRKSMSAEFLQMSADEVMAFLRADAPVRASGKAKASAKALGTAGAKISSRAKDGGAAKPRAGKTKNAKTANAKGAQPTGRTKR